MKDIILFGAGGHAKVILDIIEQQGKYRIVGIYDLSPQDGAELWGIPILPEETFIEKGVLAGIIAVGDNWKRSKIVEIVKKKCASFEFVSAIHPSAQIGKGVRIGPGTVVMAGAVVNADTEIHEHVVINTCASVDHDCQIESFASINPGAVLGGEVHVCNHSAVGIGAALNPGITIGEHSVVGSGSVVTKDIPSYVVSHGVPCEPQRKREPGPYL